MISRRSGKKRDRYWLAHHVERLCTDAGVPVVCTQSLRRLHASVATEAGATSHVVASALGHSSPAVTHAHYIDGDTARRTRTRRVISKVAPDPMLRVVGSEPAPAATATTPASRKPARRGSGMAAKPALRVIGSDATTTAATPAEPSGAAGRVGNGQ